jgi:hypothetical protein
MCFLFQNSLFQWIYSLIILLIRLICDIARNKEYYMDAKSEDSYLIIFYLILNYFI